MLDTDVPTQGDPGIRPAFLARMNHRAARRSPSGRARTSTTLGDANSIGGSCAVLCRSEPEGCIAPGREETSSTCVTRDKPHAERGRSVSEPRLCTKTTAAGLVRPARAQVGEPRRSPGAAARAAPARGRFFFSMRAEPAEGVRMLVGRPPSAPGSAAACPGRSPRSHPRGRSRRLAPNEHDACGVAFVARLDGVPSHETVVRARTALANLEHRGAEGADADTGDGAGMTLQLPDALFRAELGGPLPPLGRLRRRRLLPAARTTRAPSSSGSSRRRSRPRGRRSSPGATCRSTSGTSAARPGGAADPAALRRGRARARPTRSSGSST